MKFRVLRVPWTPTPAPTPAPRPALRPKGLPHNSGEFVLTIPEPQVRSLVPRFQCRGRSRTFPCRRFFTSEGYRAHYALTHLLRMNLK